MVLEATSVVDVSPMLDLVVVAAEELAKDVVDVVVSFKESVAELVETRSL